jgi:hypothetical protein
MRPRYASIVSVVLILVSYTAALAQTVLGSLFDESTERPIAGATVRLLNAAGQESAADVTDRTGAWTLQAPTLGSYYRVQVERIGYARVETAPFLVGMAPIRLGLVTRPEILVLEGVSTGALNYIGLLDRASQRKSARTFLPDELAGRIRRLHPRDTGRLVMNMIAGLGVTWDDWPQFESAPNMNWESVSRGLTFGGRADFRSPWEQASLLSSRRACNAIVAIDGVPHMKGRPQQILEELVSLSEVRAVEVYNDPNFVPRELYLVEKLNPLDQPPDRQLHCGVVMVWTREGIGTP